ncbi:hypothetical protein ACEWY4_014257 [Coilia grayii]|uniref:Uncharacterized protein n=1 Tax=Coilia grayii TaxID=363190 RepID=A0ABD1JRU3_9TELE
MGILMLILGYFWIIKRENTPVPSSSSRETRRVFFRRRNHLPESQSVNLQRTPNRQRRGSAEDCDYPPMEPTCFSPVARGQSYAWDLEPPPSYEVAIKSTTSSTQLTRSYSDTFRPTKPLSGCSRDVSFEV